MFVIIALFSLVMHSMYSGFAPTWPLSQTGWGIYAPGLRDLLIYTKDT